MAQDKSQFGILEAAVLLSSVKNEEKYVDVRANIVEVNLYENLYKPYVDASIALIDDFGLQTALAMQGTERLKLVLGDASNPEEPLIVKYFFFSKINDVKRLNERSELLSIDLVEEHVYIDSVKQISKSYTDTLDNIIETISQNQLKKPVTRFLFDRTVQGVRKILIPYLSPLEAISWIRDRATTKTGSPIFFYSSLYTNSLLMSDLDSLMNEPVLNEDLPLRYTSAISSMSDKDEQLRPYFEIISFRENNTQNSLQMYEDGGIGSYYATLDADTGRILGSHITIRDIIDEFYTNGLITTESVQNFFDPSLEIDGKLSDEYNSLHVHQVVSGKTYNQFKSYHEETTVVDGNNNIIESRLKIKNKIIRMILKRNVIDIGMNGSLFFEGSVTVGRKLRVLFLNSNVEGDKKTASDQIDIKKSGDYIILATNHKLINEKHTTILRMTKLGDLPRDFKL